MTINAFGALLLFGGAAATAVGIWLLLRFESGTLARKHEGT